MIERQIEIGEIHAVGQNELILTPCDDAEVDLFLCRDVKSERPHTHRKSEF